MSEVFVPHQEGALLPPSAGAELRLEQLMRRLKELKAEKEIVYNLINEMKQATESSESETGTPLDDDDDDDDDYEEATESSEIETDMTSDSEDDSDEAKESESEIPIKQDDANEEIPAEVVIAFVKELEEAHRFFDLKHYLREHEEFKKLDYGSDNIFLHIFEKAESENIFDNDQEAIWHAVQDHITEVRAEIHRKSAGKRVQKELKELFGEREEYTAAEHEEIYRMYPGLRYVEPPSMDLSNPVVKLVYETREKMPVYDMDEDPQVELRKIKKSSPMYYHKHFIYRRPPAQIPAQIRKNTVTISNLRPYDTKLHAEELLSSCGKIVQYVQERGKRKSLMIHVTFKHAKGAKAALEKESPTIDGKPVLITTPQSAPNHLKPEDVRASNDAQSVEEALRKYNELRDKYRKQ